ncbi:MAG: CvpA family protein [Sphingomonadales bacterium]
MWGFTGVDIIVLIFVFASAATGIRRGFTTEAMKLVTWAGAIFITVVTQPAAFTLANKFISVDMMANLVGMGVVFVISLVALNYLGKFIGERIRTSFMGPVDRLLGTVFGFIRGVVVVSAAFLAFSLFVAEKNYPDWVTEAKLLPYVQVGATIIAEVTPNIFDEAKDLALGYGDDTRDEMDDLVDDVADET